MRNIHYSVSRDMVCIKNHHVVLRNITDSDIIPMYTEDEAAVSVGLSR